MLQRVFLRKCFGFGITPSKTGSRKWSKKAFRWSLASTPGGFNTAVSRLDVGKELKSLKVGAYGRFRTNY